MAKGTEEGWNIVRANLKRNVVWDVGLSILQSLQGEGFPQIKEGPEVNQHRVSQMAHIYSACEETTLLDTEAVWISEADFHQVRCYMWPFVNWCLNK